MPYEIDFLPIGDKKSGDAITLRFGNLVGARREYTIVVIDGGFVADGQRVVSHLQQYYGSTYIDLLVSTHPDADHVGGMQTILKQCGVGRLWMHRPWIHAADLQNAFRNGRVTDTSIREAIRRALEGAYSLGELARSKGVPIEEPFVPTSFNGLFVLGPTREYYESLLPDFRCTPTQKGAFERLVERVLRGAADVAEDWGIETLRDDGVTSAENNSSAILLLEADNHHLLFTADAGIPALSNALDYMDSRGVGRERLRFVQVPHHGSRRNVGPTLLDRLLGEKRPTDVPSRVAYVSVAPDCGPKHPSMRVQNAFRRRGTPVYATAGRSISYSHNALQRAGWGPIEPQPFHRGIVESDEDE